MIALIKGVPSLKKAQKMYQRGCQLWKTFVLLKGKSSKQVKILVATEKNTLEKKETHDLI
ncbi:hypothetical protein TTHERM_00491080 (macronuclear) [Tetrahymena thermophila SB210]|uniref:Uncharacterized protein n=1 Tax=Tetrahymena thermophila (strain SB210) TaxID=312017 RepID=Q23J64_TETTS|nr:hypothetical protein TTHERM_00491080 [Tetrahymena thermophila SB210]EAR96640.1 hypothetical protein TTHERM_00491080 [Tetrahymena thermophila SB210]|eukprot:XP_001016885.1 hypothetical protein TTHERM_00491080 [Tetrahymena thermophila SB210]